MSGAITAQLLSHRPLDEIWYTHCTRSDQEEQSMSNVLNQGVALLPARSESQATAIAGAVLVVLIGYWWRQREGVSTREA